MSSRRSDRRLHRSPAALTTCAALAAVLAVLLTGCGDGGTPASPAAAAASSASSVAVPGDSAGPHEVSSRVLPLSDPSRSTPTAGGGERAGRALPTTLFYPTDGAGPFPVVLFSHGFSSTPEAYTALLSTWASAGFVVAAPRFPGTVDGSAESLDDVVQQPADVSFVLTAVLALDTSSSDPLAGRIDTTSVAATGHSAGAVTTVGLRSTCCADDRIDAEIVLAGTPASFLLPNSAVARDSRFTTAAVPSLFVHGDADPTLPIDQDAAVYSAAPGPKAFVSLDGGTHSAPYDQEDDPDAAAVRAATTDFLRWALSGEAAALPRLRSDVAASGTAQLRDDQLG